MVDWRSWLVETESRCSWRRILGSDVRLVDMFANVDISVYVCYSRVYIVIPIRMLFVYLEHDGNSVFSILVDSRSVGLVGSFVWYLSLRWPRVCVHVFLSSVFLHSILRYTSLKDHNEAFLSPILTLSICL